MERKLTLAEAGSAAQIQQAIDDLPEEGGRLVLPEMDGTELILKMRSSKALMRIPIVVITAAHVGRAKAEILTSFSIPALGKPWDEDELFDTLAEAFMGSAALRRKSAPKANKSQRNSKKKSQAYKVT